MASDKMIKSINHQINREIYSAYFYLGMSSYASLAGKEGVANWFTAQVKEELMHAQKMYAYVKQQGARVMLEAIEEPPQDFSSIEDLFAKTLAHEKNVSAMINDLVDLAVKEGDSATEDFLQWYVKEQGEEEETPTGILEDLKGADESGIAEVDKELSKRSFNIS